MNKSLLIHQDNVDEDRIKIGKAITFDIESDNIDREMITFINTHLSNQDLKIIIIKDSLSRNYLEFYGLLLAHHIRLSNDETIKYLPIIIISDLNIYQLNKLTSLANICYSDGIYLVDNDSFKIENLLNKDLKGLEKSNYYQSFLDFINIKPPSNYDSKHSIANEWSIYQWAKFLEIENKEIEENISSMLYFKYLQAQNPKDYLVDNSNKDKINIFQKGKILFIDDEWAKGWKQIFKKQFKSNPNFLVLEKEFKGKKQNEIIEMVINYIDINNLPDIIILDLRLSDDDFDFNYDKNLDKITGIQLIKKIHKINPAIQIILWTASGDSNILNKANSLNILGYIKKEYPGDRTVDVNNSIKILSSLIDEGLSKSYLKKIWDIQKNILELNLFKEEDDSFKQIKLEVNSVFETLDSNMENRLNYAMFAIFKCIEIITALYIEEQRRNAYWINGSQIMNTGYLKLREESYTSNLEHIKNENIQANRGSGKTATENKIRTIMNEKLGLKSNRRHSYIKCLVCIRNHTIHQDKQYEDKDFCKKVVEEKISKDNILTWFKMLQTILKKVSNEQSN